MCFVLIRYTDDCWDYAAILWNGAQAASVWPTGEQPVMLPRVNARRRKAHTAHSDVKKAAKTENRFLIVIPPFFLWGVCLSAHPRLS